MFCNGCIDEELRHEKAMEAEKQTQKKRDREAKKNPGMLCSDPMATKKSKAYKWFSGYHSFSSCFSSSRFLSPPPPLLLLLLLSGFRSRSVAFTLSHFLSSRASLILVSLTPSPNTSFFLKQRCA
jgi:hypothetical protein